MKFKYWYEGLIFIGMFLFMVGVPCALTAILGTRLIDNIGQWPSKTTRYQIGVCIQLLAVEIFSFLVLALFFHVFSE
ncbi:MAG: hypothetical protein GX606_00415 [Elusimicrobia bacterium]|nr:hypothetical protein [Elusimicrobiota bacterium]